MSPSILLVEDNAANARLALLLLQARAIGGRLNEH